MHLRNCSKNFKTFFEILFDNNNYEVKYHILNILYDQDFDFTKEDLLTIKGEWDKIKENWDKINNIDSNNLKTYDIHEKVIQDIIDTFKLPD